MKVYRILHDLEGKAENVGFYNTWEETSLAGFHINYKEILSMEFIMILQDLKSI